jgi:DNA-binding MarR family transcriptional regulator
MKRSKKVSLPVVPDTGSRTSSNYINAFQHEQTGQQGSVTRHLRDHTDWILEGWAHERPDLDVSSVAIINRLGLLQSYLHAEIGAVFERFGLTGPSFAVITTLRRVGVPYQLSQRALMDALQLTSGTISVRIDRLVQDGLVERLPDPNDQRGVLVRLMEKGTKLFDQVAPVHLANEDRLLSALTAEQREHLSSLLRILLLSFDPLAPEDPQHPSRWIGASLAAAHVARHIRRSAGLTDAPGLLVQAVAMPSPASEAGLQEGDLIVSAGGTEIRSIDCLYQKLLTVKRGTLSLEVLRGTDHHVLSLQVGELPST